MKRGWGRRRGKPSAARGLLQPFPFYDSNERDARFVTREKKKFSFFVSSWVLVERRRSFVMGSGRLVILRVGVCHLLPAERGDLDRVPGDQVPDTVKGEIHAHGGIGHVGAVAGAGAGDVDLLRCLDYPLRVEGLDQEEVLAEVQQFPGHGPFLQTETHHLDGGGIAGFQRVVEEAAVYQVAHLDLLQVQLLLDERVDGEAEVRALREGILVERCVPGEGHGDEAICQTLDNTVHAHLAAVGEAGFQGGLLLAASQP